MSSKLKKSKSLEDFCQEIMKITKCSESDFEQLIELLNEKEEVTNQKDT